MIYDSLSAHARLQAHLRTVFERKDLEQLRQALELLSSPRFERQQIVREVLRPENDEGMPELVHRAVAERWHDALPLLVQAGARLDHGALNEATYGRSLNHDEARAARRWYSAVHDLLSVASIDAAQQRPSAQRKSKKEGRILPDATAIVMTLRTLCELGARVNGKDGNGATPLNLVCSGTGWWTSTKAQGATLDENFDSIAKAQSFSVGDALLRVLLNAGADPNITDDHGQNLLHHLVLSSKDTRPFLRTLHAGGDANIDDENGETAIMLAQRLKLPALLAALAEKEKEVLRKTLESEILKTQVSEVGKADVLRQVRRRL